MADVHDKKQVERAIRTMEAEMPESWGGPTMWTDISNEVIDMIVDQQDVIQPVHLAVLMTIGAMALRQARTDRQVKRGDAQHG